MNSADAKGGSIFYDLYGPIGLKDPSNEYAGNSAPYGPDYGSFPFALA